MVKRIIAALWILLTAFPVAADSSRTWTHTTQADFMAAEQQGVDVRALDALGTPYGYDADPRGSVRLQSRPGPRITHHPSWASSRHARRYCSTARRWSSANRFSPHSG